MSITESLKHLILVSPVYLVLVTVAIISAVGTAEMAKSSLLTKEHSLATKTTISIWVVMVLGACLSLLFAVMNPLWGATWMFTLSMYSLATSIIFFYLAVKIKKTPDYNTTSGKNAYKNMIITGSLMLSACLLTIGYGMYDVHRHSKGERGHLLETAVQAVAPETIPAFTALNRAKEAVPIKEQTTQEATNYLHQLGSSALEQVRKGGVPALKRAVAYARR